MAIEKLLLSDCSEGDIIARDVINRKGITLVAKETIINNYIKEKLATHEIKYLWIYRESDIFEIEFKSSYLNAIIQTKKIFNNLISGESIDLAGISSITKLIQSYIHESDRVVRYLEKICDADEYTYTHCINVAFYSMLIAKWLDISTDKIEKAIQAGLLHDLGKIKIPNKILNKKGKLSNDEFEIVKKHTILGYELVKDINEIDNDIKLAILLHHERMDGSGYPYHYNQDDKDLNIYSRIVALADVFDAMTTDRVYKKRSTPFEVFEMFQTIGISMFDTKILDLFIKRLTTYLVGSKVILTNGDIGEIVYIPIQRVTNPVIKVSSEYIDLSQITTIKVSSML